MPRPIPVVQDTPVNFEIVVRAYAHSIMEDILTDLAMVQVHREVPMPKSLEEVAATLDMVETFGIRFEETFLQGNAPQWANGYVETGAKPHPAFELRDRALNLVDMWLKAANTDDGARTVEGERFV